MNAYIADNNDGNKVELEILPTPQPLTIYQPQLEMKQKINRYANGEVVAGGYDFFIGKPALQGSIINCSILKMTLAQYNSICGKMGDSVIFSPNGSIKYECAFHSSTGEPAYIEGTSYITWNIVFAIIRQV